jgi:hypothetical protein
MGRILLNADGQFRTTQGPVISYLGLTWDYSEPGYYVKVSRAGMIRDIVARREKFHKDRGANLPSIPKNPATPHLYDRTPDCKLLDAHDAENFWTETASLAQAGNRAHPSFATTIGDLQRHVTRPTTEDESKLDRLIAFAKVSA